MPPEQPENAGRVEEPRAALSSLPIGARASEPCCVQVHSLSLRFFQLGMLFKKQSLVEGQFWCGCLTTSIWPFLSMFPPIPVFLTSLAPGWHSWMSLQALRRTHRRRPSLLFICFAYCLLLPCSQTPERATTHPAPLAGPRGRWLGDAAGAPIRQHRGGDSWAPSPRRQDQLLGAQYAPVFLSSCCC